MDRQTIGLCAVCARCLVGRGRRGEPREEGCCQRVGFASLEGWNGGGGRCWNGMAWLGIADRGMEMWEMWPTDKSVRPTLSLSLLLLSPVPHTGWHLVSVAEAFLISYEDLRREFHLLFPVSVCRPSSTATKQTAAVAAEQNQKVTLPQWRPSSYIFVYNVLLEDRPPPRNR